MSVRTQEIKETAEVPSSEGLMVNVEASLLYNLSPEMAPEVYRTLGNNYVSVFVEPQFRSHLRGITASFEAKALYTSQREIISSKVEESIQPVFTKRGFASANVLLRKITLPQLVTAAIEQKLSAEQDAQRMAFVLQKEEQEAQRKRVEARGIKDFQAIVTQGITPQLLTWKGIEATERLANSDNSKIVVIGAGKGGLPLILNPAQ
jgi:regulator of protease activity HflC (stomatin/prohibitin superfamily)